MWRDIVPSGRKNRANGNGDTVCAPLGHADLDAVKKQFGFEEGAANVFKTPPDVGGVYSACTQAGAMRQKAWEAMCVRYAKAHPGLAAEFARRQAGKLPVNWKELLPR